MSNLCHQALSFIIYLHIVPLYPVSVKSIPFLCGYSGELSYLCTVIDYCINVISTVV